jgi:lipopolysaccharide/colanic/teichoic acid biosynthesis glycosyltransferase
MEKLIAQIEVDEGRNANISKSMVKGKLKSLRKVSKTYRAMQLIKYKAEIYTYNFIKRAVDICAGLFGSILLLPIMAVVKIAYLKQGDHAPVLFKQKRIGKDGKEIEILKVRSMVYNAEEVLEKLMKENPEIREEYKKNKKLEHDPRVTKIGAFIRKTSLDEFGQFVRSTNWKNVIGRTKAIFTKRERRYGGVLL